MARAWGGLRVLGLRGGVEEEEEEDTTHGVPVLEGERGTSIEPSRQRHAFRKLWDEAADGWRAGRSRGRQHRWEHVSHTEIVNYSFVHAALGPPGRYQQGGQLRRKMGERQRGSRRTDRAPRRGNECSRVEERQSGAR